MNIQSYAVQMLEAKLARKDGRKEVLCCPNKVRLSQVKQALHGVRRRTLMLDEKDKAGGNQNSESRKPAEE